MNIWNRHCAQNIYKKNWKILPDIIRAEFFKFFRSYFGHCDDFIYSFWNFLTFMGSIRVIFIFRVRGKRTKQSCNSWKFDFKRAVSKHTFLYFTYYLDALCTACFDYSSNMDTLTFCRRKKLQTKFQFLKWSCVRILCLHTFFPFTYKHSRNFM